MRVFGQRAPEPDRLASYIPKPPKLRVLRADGQRIDLTSRDTGQMLVATRSTWQQTAWAYRDMIGELRYVYQLLGQAVSQVRFYPAASRPGSDDLADLTSDELPDDLGLDAQLIADTVHNFGRIPFDADPDGFTARATENLGVAGEFWIHIDADEQWQVRSTSEVTASADGRITINMLPSATAGSVHIVDPNSEDLLRCWRAHPEWGQLADSALRAVLDVCEDVVLAGREQRSAARSRLAANGVLLIPDSMSLVQARDEDDDYDDTVASDTFLADFTQAMLAPIRDDGDAQAVVPIVIRGDSDDLEKVRHVTLTRADSEELIARQDSALLRLLKSLDVQPEQVQGVSGMNHWGAWSIDVKAIKEQVAPTAKMLAACLMAAFLKPALESLSHPVEQLGRIRIGVDVTGLAENPNRAQDAKDAHDRETISDAALREAMGFDDEDAPDEIELVRRALTKGRITPEALPMIVEALKGRLPSTPTIINPSSSGGGGGARPALPPAESPPPAAQPGQTTPAQPTPAAPDLARGPQPSPSGPGPAAVTAAAAVDPQYALRVDPDLSALLGDIDAALLDRIITASDAAVARVVEKAGARVRSAAQRDKAVAASLVGVDTAFVAATLGRDGVERFVNIQDLLADGHQRLRGQVQGWLSAAAQQTAGVVLRMLGLKPSSPRGRRVEQVIVSRLAAKQQPALQRLDDILETAAERALFEPDPLVPAAPTREESPAVGEQANTLVRPSEAAEVLALAGGGTPNPPANAPTRAPVVPPQRGPGGVATGPVVTEVMGDEGAALLGWEWQYRPEIARAHPFPPHEALNGLRFATFTDPKLDTDAATAWLGLYFHPQDHDGCLCRAVPIYAIPELDDGIVARRLREARGNWRNIRAGEIAADDDAAGRIGTSLQNEVEVRGRITKAIERMQAEHIGGTP